jgi:uncharacterized membrane protein
MARKDSLEHVGAGRESCKRYSCTLSAFWQEENGAQLVLSAFALLVLLAFAALAVDVGYWYLEQQRMQIAADAAALEGARQLAINANPRGIDENIKSLIKGDMRSLAQENRAETVKPVLEENNRSAAVTVERVVPSFFASVLGIYTTTVRADAEARYQPISATGNLYPLTFSCTCWTDDKDLVVENVATVISLPPTCKAGACLVSSPRLLSVDTTQSTLLNPLLEGLLGVKLNVNVLDWNGLASLDVTLGQLQLALGVATTDELLDMPISLGQLLNALDTVLPLGLPGALRSIIVQLPVGAIRLGDILDVDPGVTAYSDIGLNALDLVTAAFQLFNHKHVVDSEVRLSLPIAGVVGNGLTLKVRVIEPPVFVCGDEGTTFHSAAMRLAVHVDLVDLSILRNLILISTEVRVSQLDLYVEVASGTGLIGAIDALAKTVTVQATPSVANLYVGKLDDVTFAQNRPINPATDLKHGSIGHVRLKVLLGVAAANLDLGLKLSAQATPASARTLHFTGHGAGNYPETLTATAGASSLTSLLGTLVSSVSSPDAIHVDLSVSVLGAITLNLGEIVSVVVNVLTALLDPVGGVLYSVLGNVLSGLLDPLLDLLGIGLGEMDVTVLGVVNECGPGSDDGGDGGGGDQPEADCPFQWIKWDEDILNDNRIVNYMNDVSQSGIRHVGQDIEIEVDLDAITAANNEFGAHLGDIVTIPLTVEDDGKYAICGFTNVELIDHNLEHGWIKLRVVSQLIHGEAVSASVPDLGLRDVRLTR